MSKTAGLVTNYVESDQAFCPAASDLDLHCLLRSGCPNTSVLLNIQIRQPDKFNIYQSLGKFSSRHSDDILTFFSQKIGFYFSYKLSPKQTTCMKCQNLFLVKNKNISKCLPRILSVNSFDILCKLSP